MYKKFGKRFLDIVLSGCVILFFWWVIKLLLSSNASEPR